MFGLGKKTPPPEAATPKLSVPVVTIPTEFYAGANPTITFKKVEKVIVPTASAPIPSADKKAFDKATAPGANQPLHPASVFGNRKKVILIGGGLFGLFVIGAGGYYWFTATKPTPTPPAPKKVVIATPSAPVAPVVVPSTTPVVTTPEPVTPNILEGQIEFPSLLLTKAVDLDSDGLTDAEEAMFKSDPGIPDTDSDGHTDGTEVFYLYNPVGKEPIKLVESGTVLEYTNPIFNYAMYYPVEWQIGNVNGDNRDMLFSSIVGDHVEVRVFDKPSQQTFAEWLSENAASQKFGDLIQSISRFNEPNYMRTDELVYYYAGVDKVYVLVYHPAPESTVVNFPGVFEMMARSFRSDASRPVSIPDPVMPSAFESDGLPDAPTL